MSELPGIVIAGASGRMGKMLIESVLKDDRMRLVGALERAGHDWVGRDVGVAMGGQPLGVPVFDDPLEPMANAQAVIDFTAPEATIALSGIAAQARAAHIIGTTGMTDDQIAQLEPASRHSPIVRAGNMSLGVNLLVQLTRQVATALDEDFDIEVIEAHHHHKVDAPSGTALMLGEAAAEGAVSTLPRCAMRPATGSRAHASAAISGSRSFEVATLWANTKCFLRVRANALCSNTWRRIVRCLPKGHCVRPCGLRPRCRGSMICSTFWDCADNPCKSARCFGRK